MNSNSIINKLIVVFVIVVVFFSTAIFAYYYYENESYLANIQEDYSKISKQIFDKRLPPKKIDEYIISLGFEFEPNPRKIIDSKSNILSGRGYELIVKDSTMYMHVFNPEYRALFRDLNTYKHTYYGFVILASLFIFFIITFLWIIKTLLPLKRLKNQIENFANGDLYVECKSENKDEIAQVANEFDRAVKKIALLLESRQLFLRTVMHELKTPIAKGKIVVSLIDDEVQKDRISIIFNKLNYLIDDFAKTEQVISQNYSIQKHSNSISGIVDSAIEMMMIDKVKDKISIKVTDDKKIDVDLELFALALKNLIDNGIKYSKDHKVIVEEKENSLFIVSEGAKLLQPLEEYFKPFHNETKKKNHGMGLGLYIVNSILEMHGMSLFYRYDLGINTFQIKF